MFLGGTAAGPALRALLRSLQAGWAASFPASIHWRPSPIMKILATNGQTTGASDPAAECRQAAIGSWN